MSFSLLPFGVLSVDVFAASLPHVPLMRYTTEQVLAGGLIEFAFVGRSACSPWNAMSKPWELLLHLATRAERLDGVDQYDLSGAPGAGVLSTRKYRL
jgi:hypothetical protein